MKKIVAVVLCVLMLFPLAIPALAAADAGTITINGVAEGYTYEIYKLLDLESHDAASGAYAYTVNSAWAGFFATDDALNYVAVNAAGYVTWIGDEDDASVAAFAKLALAYAKTSGIAADKSSKNDGDFAMATDAATGTTRGTFSGLSLGYYLVDSTVGALCGLTTTKPDAFIHTKNGIPTIEKEVMEDSTSQWGDSNTADIGQTVYFRATITAQAGAEKYIVHDILSSGFTFRAVSKVEHIRSGANGAAVAAPNTDYTVWTKAGITDGTADDTSDSCVLEIRFADTFCDTLEADDQIVVYYEATLNEDAVIAGEGNPNEVWLEYGENNQTTHDITKTYTFGLDIIKTDSQNTLVDGAEFKLYDALTGGNEVAVVLMDDGVTYRRAAEDETGVSILVKDGKARVVGFDSDTYYLEETVAPQGYNKLTARQPFTIADQNLDSIFGEDGYSTGSGVQVVNKTGSVLPETGGLGTTLFVVIGAVVVLGTGILLFARKRLSQVAE